MADNAAAAAADGERALRSLAPEEEFFSVHSINLHIRSAQSGHLSRVKLHPAPGCCTISVIIGSIQSFFGSTMDEQSLQVHTHGCHIFSDGNLINSSRIDLHKFG